jgi:hypothetical protein
MTDDLHQVKCLLRRFVLVEDEMQQQFCTAYVPKADVIASLKRWDWGGIKVHGVDWQIEKILERNE